MCDCANKILLPWRKVFPLQLDCTSTTQQSGVHSPALNSELQCSRAGCAPRVAPKPEALRTAFWDVQTRAEARILHCVHAHALTCTPTTRPRHSHDCALCSVWICLERVTDPGSQSVQLRDINRTCIAHDDPRTRMQSLRGVRQVRYAHGPVNTDNSSHQSVNDVCTDCVTSMYGAARTAMQCSACTAK